MGEELVAEMGCYVVGDSKTTLMALGLGSCIGCIIYDPVKKIGGMAHIMLPDSSINTSSDKMNKFADIAIPAMFNDLKKMGSSTKLLVAKIAGGGQMFALADDSDILSIGKRNREAVIKQLEKLDLKLTLDETGGCVGRTVKFNVETGETTIRTKEGIKTYENKK